MAKCDFCHRHFDPRRSGGLPQVFCCSQHKREYEKLVRNLGLQELRYRVHALQLCPAEIKELDTMCQGEDDGVGCKFETCKSKTCETGRAE